MWTYLCWYSRKYRPQPFQPAFRRLVHKEEQNHRSVPYTFLHKEMHCHGHQETWAPVCILLKCIFVRACYQLLLQATANLTVYIGPGTWIRFVSFVVASLRYIWHFLKALAKANKSKNEAAISICCCTDMIYQRSCCAQWSRCHAVVRGTHKYSTPVAHAERWRRACRSCVCEWWRRVGKDRCYTARSPS